MVCAMEDGRGTSREVQGKPEARLLSKLLLAAVSFRCSLDNIVFQPASTSKNNWYCIDGFRLKQSKLSNYLI